MFARHWLVSFSLRSRVYFANSLYISERMVMEMALDTVVYGEVDGPCRQVAQDRRTKAPVHATYSVMPQDGLDGG